MGDSKDNSRVIWADWTRALACFLVMVVHSTEPFYLGSDGLCIMTHTDVWWCALFEGASRACVPLFVVISGYLLLPVRKPAKVFLGRRLKRIVIPFVFWSLMYAVFAGDFRDNISNLALNFNYSAGHLWFVYMIIGLYLLMPVISPWVDKASRKELLAYLVLCLLTGMLPYIRDIMSGSDIAVIYGPTGIPERAAYPLWGEASWNEYGMFYYFSGFIGYVLLGAFLRKFYDEGTKKFTSKIAVPSLITGFGICVYGFIHKADELSGGVFPLNKSLDGAVSMETALNYDTLGVALLTLGSISLLVRIINCGKFYRNIIKPVSQASYGMYLMHIFVLSAVSVWLGECPGTGGGLPGDATTPLRIALTATITYVVVAVAAIAIQKIPCIGKWVIG